MYDSGPSNEELAALGMDREDFLDTSDFEVWPDNWLPYQIFCDVSRQWVCGPSGPIGLDFGAVEWVVGLYKVKPKKQLEVLHAIRILESSALTQMSKS